MLAALLVPLARATLRRLRLLVSLDTVLRWYRDLIKRRHARTSANRRPGRPRTVASIRGLVLRRTTENPSSGYRRIHGELALLYRDTASTMWEILKTTGVDPAPRRTTVTWTDFVRSGRKPVVQVGREGVGCDAERVQQETESIVGRHAVPARATDLFGLPPASIDVGSAEDLPRLGGFHGVGPLAAISQAAWAERVGWLRRMQQL